jgi:cytosine/adenosine deaminase-related metal-dependent hydrolase
MARLLLKGGTVLSMDPGIGDLPTGDVLIEDDRIVQVAPAIEADAEVLDCTGRIVIPGFIDSHRHTWETAIRNCAPNATLDDYFVEILDSFAPLYSPDDVYASNLAGALECLNAGITTLVDWSHINNTPEHPDAGITGLRDAGIRAQYAYGSANTSLEKYWYFSSEAIPGDDVRRIKESYFTSDDQLLTLALATRGPGFTQDQVVRSEWQLARDLGIPITLHAGMARLAGRYAMVEELNRLGLLGSDITYIHCNFFSDHEWKLVADTGGTISIAPQVELQMNHGWAPANKAREFGLKPSLSIDVVTTVPGDMFTQIRAVFAGERARVNDVCWVNNLPTPENMLTARDVLEMATINGARVAGLDGVVGSLTPGKKADVVVIDATAVNVAPVNDPVAAVTLSADVSNVQHVLVNGEFRKRDFQLAGDLSRAMTLVGQAKDRLQAALADRRAAAARAAEAAPTAPEDSAAVTVVQAVAATDANGAVQDMGTVPSTGVGDAATGAL